MICVAVTAIKASPNLETPLDHQMRLCQLALKHGGLMKKLILILGAGQMISGIFFGIEAGSAIHQILAYGAFGMGSICLALGVLIGRIDEGNDLKARQTTLLEAQSRKSV